ncbi:hypothetical protein ACFVT5_07590 [Streptomyces sp. NPDC058001]|uniref:hypothetical protein n=1 Tax=Streptomyces sp. NPDC058001 TaxID=3346300 RepID=UPI0036EDDF54
MTTESDDGASAIRSLSHDLFTLGDVRASAPVGTRDVLARRLASSGTMRLVVFAPSGHPCARLIVPEAARGPAGAVLDAVARCSPESPGDELPDLARALRESEAQQAVDSSVMLVIDGAVADVAAGTVWLTIQLRGAAWSVDQAAETLHTAVSAVADAATG